MSGWDTINISGVNPCKKSPSSSKYPTNVKCAQNSKKSKMVIKESKLVSVPLQNPERRSIMTSVTDLLCLTGCIFWQIVVITFTYWCLLLQSTFQWYIRVHLVGFLREHYYYILVKLLLSTKEYIYYAESFVAIVILMCFDSSVNLTV